MDTDDEKGTGGEELYLVEEAVEVAGAGWRWDEPETAGAVDAEEGVEGSRTGGSLSTTDLERGFAQIRSAMDYAMRQGRADGQDVAARLRRRRRRISVGQRRQSGSCFGGWQDRSV